MSLRVRLGLSFALVAVTTSLVMVAAMPVVIRYGFEPVLPPETPLSPTPVPGAPSGEPASASPISSPPAPGTPTAAPNGTSGASPTDRPSAPAGSGSTPAPSGPGPSGPVQSGPAGSGQPGGSGGPGSPRPTPSPTPRPTQGGPAGPSSSPAAERAADGAPRWCRRPGSDRCRRHERRRVARASGRQPAADDTCSGSRRCLGPRPDDRPCRDRIGARRRRRHPDGRSFADDRPGQPGVGRSGASDLGHPGGRGRAIGRRRDRRRPDPCRGPDSAAARPRPRCRCDRGGRPGAPLPRERPPGRDRGAGPLVRHHGQRPRRVGRRAPSLPAGRGTRAGDAGDRDPDHGERDPRRRLRARAAPPRDDPRRGAAARPDRG